MPDEDNRTLKYNHGEKSLKVPFIVYADLDVYYKKHVHIKIILKNLAQREKLSIYLQVTHGVQFLHLMHQKTNVVITESKTKSFVKTLEIKQ